MPPSRRIIADICGLAPKRRLKSHLLLDDIKDLIGALRMPPLATPQGADTIYNSLDVPLSTVS